MPAWIDAVAGWGADRERTLARYMKPWLPVSDDDIKADIQKVAETIIKQADRARDGARAMESASDKSSYGQRWQELVARTRFEAQRLARHPDIDNRQGARCE